MINAENIFYNANSCYRNSISQQQKPSKDLNCDSSSIESQTSFMIYLIGISDLPSNAEYLALNMFVLRK